MNLSTSKYQDYMFLPTCIYSVNFLDAIELFHTIHTKYPNSHWIFEGKSFSV